MEGGRVYVAIDGQPVAGLPTVAGRTYLPLRATRTSDADLPVVAGLRPGPHTLELTAGEDGEVAIAGLIVSRERPLGWAYLWLHGAALVLLTLALRSLLRLGLVVAGYLPVVRIGRRGGARDTG
jgi:hypothetical protein